MLNEIVNQNVFELFRKLKDNSVDMVLTDPPYLLSRKTNFLTMERYRNVSGTTKYSGMNFGEWDQEFDTERYVAECCRILKPSRSIIVWGAWMQLPTIENTIKATLKKQTGSSRIGVWHKTNGAPFNMKKMAINSFEFFVWNRKGSNWIFNNQRAPAAEQHYFKCGTVQHGHPTAKPISIFEYLIETYTNKGQVIFDGCMGGGTTAIAAAKTGRHFIGAEADPEWHELALSRLAEL